MKSPNKTETLWVVVKLVYDDFGKEITPVVEDQGYWDKSYAEKRAKHVLTLDDQLAWVYPVRFESLLGVPVADPEKPRGPLLVGALTTGRGRELVAYHVPGVDPSPRLSQTVSETWLSWRLQQANLGNLDEAGLAGPDTQQLESLYGET